MAGSLWGFYFFVPRPTPGVCLRKPPCFPISLQQTMSAVPEPGAQVPTDADAVGLGPEAMQAIARDAMAQAADAAAAGSGAGPQSSDVQPPPAMPPPGAALPSGWIEETDANSGMPIYFNTGTGEIMFERPGAGPPPEDPPPPYPAPAPASATGAGSDHAHAGPPSGSATSSAIGAPRAALHSAPRSSAARLGQIRTQVTETLFGSAGTTVTAGAGSQPRRLTPCTVRGAGPWYVDMQAVPHPRFRELPALGPFPTEAAARAAARHEAPPVWVDEDHCNRCRQGFGLLQRRTHCRNCGYSMCRGCCKTWPRAALPALYPKDGESASRICLGCNANVDAFRAALLAGDTDAARRAYADGRANLNLRCFLPATSDGEGARGGAVLLPVHLAAVANSLATLKWLAEEEHCPVVGPDAMSLGKPSKYDMLSSVFTH